MSKLIFFDIDGTLLNARMQVPQSTADALKILQEQGHKIAICSGRPLTMIYPFLLEMGFDGVIASAGAYIRYGDELLYRSTLEQEPLEMLTELLERHRAAYYLQGCPGSFLTAKSWETIRNVFFSGKSAETIRKDMKICENPATVQGMESGVYIHSDATVAEMQKEVDEQINGYFKLTGCSFGSDIIYSGEITKKGVNKATGMQRLMDAMGIAREDTVAFGDGSNDFEMIEYAATGIVMGNGIPALKERANYVTTDIDADGIWNGLAHLKLLS